MSCHIISYRIISCHTNQTTSHQPNHNNHIISHHIIRWAPYEHIHHCNTVAGTICLLQHKKLKSELKSRNLPLLPNKKAHAPWQQMIASLLPGCPGMSEIMRFLPLTLLLRSPLSLPQWPYLLENHVMFLEHSTTCKQSLSRSLTTIFNYTSYLNLTISRLSKKLMKMPAIANSSPGEIIMMSK